MLCWSPICVMFLWKQIHHHNRIAKGRMEGGGGKALITPFSFQSVLEVEWKNALLSSNRLPAGYLYIEQLQGRACYFCLSFHLWLSKKEQIPFRMECSLPVMKDVLKSSDWSQLCQRGSWSAKSWPRERKCFSCNAVTETSNVLLLFEFNAHTHSNLIMKKDSLGVSAVLRSESKFHLRWNCGHAETKHL